MIAARWLAGGALVALVALADLAAGEQAGPGADPAIAWLAFARSCFATADTAEAAVVHEVVHSLGAAREPRRAVLRLQRGGRFRLEYADGAREIVVSDGKAIRAWDPARRIFYEEPAEATALAAVLGLAFDGDGAARRARWLGGGAAPTDGAPAALELAFDGIAPPARVAVALAPSCPSLTRVVVADRSGVAIRLTIRDLRLGVRFAGRPFALSPPRGARVVRP